MNRMNLLCISRHANDSSFGNENTVDHGTTLGCHARKTGEGCTQAKGLINYTTEVRELSELLEVKRRLWVWEGFVKLGLELLVGLGVREEVVEDEGENSGSRIGTYDIRQHLDQK